MTNLDNIIMDIMEINCARNFWFREKNGEIKDGAIIMDIIPFLKQLKPYEINISQDIILDLREFLYDKLKFGNTYNCKSHVDHDLKFDYYISPTNNKAIIFVSVHKYGDICVNYTDMACLRFDNISEFFESPSAIYTKQINKRYVANMHIFKSGYDVWNCIDDIQIGHYDNLTAMSLLESIIENKKIVNDI